MPFCPCQRKVADSEMFWWLKEGLIKEPSSHSGAFPFLFNLFGYVKSSFYFSEKVSSKGLNGNNKPRDDNGLLVFLSIWHQSLLLLSERCKSFDSTQRLLTLISSGLAPPPTHIDFQWVFRPQQSVASQTEIADNLEVQFGFKFAMSNSHRNTSVL